MLQRLGLILFPSSFFFLSLLLSVVFWFCLQPLCFVPLYYYIHMGKSGFGF